MSDFFLLKASTDNGDVVNLSVVSQDDFITELERCFVQNIYSITGQSLLISANNITTDSSIAHHLRRILEQVEEVRLKNTKEYQEQQKLKKKKYEEAKAKRAEENKKRKIEKAKKLLEEEGLLK